MIKQLKEHEATLKQCRIIVAGVAISTGPALLVSRGPLCEDCSLLSAWVDIII